MATPFPFTSGQTLTAAQMNAVTTLPVSTKTVSYTAVLGDVGSRIVMNVASANTITINNSIFAEGDTIFIANKGAGATTITAGAGVTINTSGSLVLAQHGGGTLVALSASVFGFFSGGGANYGVATGGSSSSITVDGINYTLLTFTTDDTLVVSKAGLFDVLLVAGGAGGGGGVAAVAGGGGGAGQIVGLAATTTIYLSANQSIDVGAGGTGSASAPTAGSGSSIGSIVAAAGGGQAGANQDTVAGLIRAQGQSGGSGGGTCFSNFANLAVAPFGGNNSGVGFNAAGGGGIANAAGGGGAGAVGGNSANGTSGGAGGNGAEINTFIAGSSYFAAAGGGGGATGTGGTAGSGGVAGKTSGTGNNAVNYGSGGGGTVGAAGGNGAAGVVYVRFKV